MERLASGWTAGLRHRAHVASALFAQLQLLSVVRDFIKVTVRYAFQIHALDLACVEVEVAVVSGVIVIFHLQITETFTSMTAQGPRAK